MWACDLWQPLPQTEVLGADTDREEEEDVIKKLLPSLPELGIGGSQKLISHIPLAQLIPDGMVLVMGSCPLGTPSSWLLLSSFQQVQPLT